MPITCQICQTEFQKIIPWQHLKLHNITTAAYKDQYGPVYSPETIAKHAEKIPHNKGKKMTDQAQLNAHREAIAKREIRFQNGEFTRGAAKTTEQKELHRIKSKDHANANPELMKQRAVKAISTKKDKGYDFGSPMRGKKHSNDTKVIIQQSLVAANQQKATRANTQILEKIQQLNLTLVNTITDTQLKLQCNKCLTEFIFTKQYFHPSKIKETLCPGCYPRVVHHSKGETELFEFIKALCPDAIQGYKLDNKYHNKEIDIYVPSVNVGFEFNGLYYHSEQVLIANNKSPTADCEKQAEFLTNGIHLISIFSDEWEEKKEIVQSRVSNILKKTTNTIYARQCSLQEVLPSVASRFCETNHIMGKGRSNVRLGLYYNTELVSLMTFTNNNLSRKSNVWEINRFASKLNVSVIGAASKLFSAFVKLMQPDRVISYADKRWSLGGLYSALGFNKVSDGTPNYWYVKPNGGRIHRFTLRKTKDDDQSLTELENRLAQGYLRIWDCGSSKWEWSQSNK